MRYLVLGSEGQIGKPLVSFLRGLGHEVEEYDIKRNPIEDLRIINTSLEAKAIFHAKLKKTDFIFFLAFDVGGSKYLKEREGTFNFIENNIKIMANVFANIKKYNKPFIFTSTQMSDMTHSSYGNAKLIGEKYTLSLKGLYVKLWNVYGPETNVEADRAHVVTDFINMAKHDGVINMRTSGRESRQFLYVEDCCEALFELSKKYDSVPRNKELHISSFKWHTIEEVAEITSELYNCVYTKGNLKDIVQLNLKYEPDTFILKYWQPRTSLTEGIQKINDTISKR